MNLVSTRKVFITLAWILAAVISTDLFADYEVKLRDITLMKGIKKNRVYGYGLVVGLNGSGDGQSPLAKKTLNQFLSYAGIEMNENRLDAPNIAVVAVSAELNGFVGKGDLVDIQVASVGSARSIENGMLLQTVLKAGNGETYVVAGGVVGTGGANQPRRGMIAAGGIVERDVGKELGLFKENQPFQLILKNPSLPMASAIKEAIETANPDVAVTIQDYKQIQVAGKNATALTHKVISDILNLPVNMESAATVVIDKQTGVIVGGQDVRIDTAFVSLPGLNIALKDGQSDKVKNLSGVIKANTTVNDLANEFNGLGIKPLDLISIFTALKKAGALNAEIIIQ